MFRVIKKSGKTVKAYCLGEQCSEISRFIAEGKIIPRRGGVYEVMSEEAFNGGSGSGETACDGDFIKVSSYDFPYPNKRDFFLNNHRHISGDDYEQLPVPLDAWDINEPMCEEMEFLINSGRLSINEAETDKYFSAFLWGTMEGAARDAVIVFYSVSRDSSGRITDADFNFVRRTEFEQIYNIVTE